GARLCRPWQELCPLSEWDQFGSKLHFTSLFLCVSDAPRYTTIQITPREAVREGDSVTLTCSSDGAPPAESFAWFKEGESGSVPDSFRPELRLWSLDYRDHGEYFCVARNPLGTDRSRPILLNVTCRLSLFLCSQKKNDLSSAGLFAYTLKK
uniref:Ig-like domain-containing protein n=1 Tax=Sinocyclocheilus grahami TaxID=75366 RepID=A0A672K4L7_SINGR